MVGLWWVVDNFPRIGFRKKTEVPEMIQLIVTSPRDWMLKNSPYFKNRLWSPKPKPPWEYGTVIPVEVGTFLGDMTFPTSRSWGECDVVIVPWRALPSSHRKTPRPTSSTVLLPMPNLPPTGTRPGIPKRSNLRWSDLDDEEVREKHGRGWLGWDTFLGGRGGLTWWDG